MSFHPQTPQSPSQSSPATSLEHSSSLSTSMTSITTTLPTPAHSVNGSSGQPDSAMTDESPHKRKRPLEDLGGRDQKKVHLEDCKFGIEDLHRDVGQKYLLCQSRKDPLADLLSLLLRGLVRSRQSWGCIFAEKCLLTIPSFSAPCIAPSNSR